VRLFDHKVKAICGSQSVRLFYGTVSVFVCPNAVTANARAVSGATANFGHIVFTVSVSSKEE